MASTYVFRDDLEADKQRAADAQVMTLGAPQPAAPAMPAAPQPTPQPAPTAPAAAAPSQAENPFEAFSKALEAQNPFKQQVKQNVQQTLANPGAAADAATVAARDRLARENNAAQEETRSQAISMYGGYQTGQAGQALDKFRNARLMNEQSFELDAAANKAGAVEQARNNAINQGVSLLGQEEQSRIADAQLAQNERMQDKQIASTEKMTYAGLELNRDQFEAADANAKKGLSLEESAQQLQKMGMDRDEAFRYAQLAQEKSIADQDIASREKLAMAQIGSAERLEASRQVYQSEQNKLDRELEKLLSNDRIQAQFQLADLDQTFQERMQANGFVQERELENMRADLQTRLQERGIAADVAKQIADQKFTELMAGRDQAFEERMTTLKQSWASGERIATQDWEGAMRASDQLHEEKITKLQSLLRLDEQQNAQAFQSAFQQMQNDFTLYRDTLGYDRETATRLAQEAFQERMTQAGFDQDTAMQATQLAHQVSENQKSRASQEMMAAASLAQQDSQFMQELEQRYHFSSEDLELRKQELGAQLQLMGLQGKQLEAALANDKIQNAMQIAALGMEIGDGSEGSMAPFVEQLGAALEGYMKGQGIDISSSDFVKALSSTGTPGTTGAVPGSADALADAKVQVDDILGRLPASVNRDLINSALDKTAKGGYSKSDLGELHGLPGFSGKPYAVGGKTYFIGNETPEMKDYAGFYFLTKAGVPEADAAKIMITTIGDQRFKAAYKALTGKDWT
jgi:hypothetical protein